MTKQEKLEQSISGKELIDLEIRLNRQGKFIAVLEHVGTARYFVTIGTKKNKQPILSLTKD